MAVEFGTQELLDHLDSSIIIHTMIGTDRSCTDNQAGKSFKYGTVNFEIVHVIFYYAEMGQVRGQRSELSVAHR